jgi:hypothetical protein
MLAPKIFRRLLRTTAVIAIPGHPGYYAGKVNGVTVCCLKGKPAAEAQAKWIASLPADQFAIQMGVFKSAKWYIPINAEFPVPGL